MYVRFRKHALLILLAVIGVSHPGQVPAQPDGCDLQRGKTSGALDEVTWNRLNDIYEDIGEARYDVAFEKLQSLSAKAYGSYYQAVLAQLLGQVEWARSNYGSALAGFEKALALDALPDAAHFSLMYQIAQLYYLENRYNEALDSLGMWMCRVPAEEINANSYMLQASIYAQKEEWSQVVAAIEKAISISDEPKEAWYQLKLASHFELEQLAEAAQTLEILIQNWPVHKSYWMQLSQIYYKLEMQDKALSVIALAYRRQMLEKQTDILYLSSLYSNNNVPFKAASILQKGIRDGLVTASRKNWIMVADAWYAAAELDDALAAYEIAGEVSDDGETDLRRAYILVDMERWSEASTAIAVALEKGGLTAGNTGDAYVIQGMTEFNLGNYNKAMTAFGHASKYPKAKMTAQQWINHLREEQARKSS